MSCLTSAATAVARSIIIFLPDAYSNTWLRWLPSALFVRGRTAGEWDANAFVGRIWATNARRRLNEKAERVGVPLQVNGLFCFLFCFFVGDTNCVEQGIYQEGK